MVSREEQGRDCYDKALILSKSPKTNPQPSLYGIATNSVHWVFWIIEGALFIAASYSSRFRYVRITFPSIPSFYPCLLAILLSADFTRHYS